MDKQELQAKLEDIRAEIKALPARFELQTGKLFTYEAKCGRENEWELKIKRVYRKGETSEPFNGIELTAGGTVKYFSFHSFSGTNSRDAAEAYEYARECAELLSEDFISKVMADFKAKLAALDALAKQEDAVCAEISRIESRERTEKHAAEKEAQEALTAPGQIWIDLSEGMGCRLVVESQTEKSVAFSYWYQDNEKTWELFEGARKTVQKRNLGKRSQMSRFRDKGILPTGKTEFTEIDWRKLGELPRYEYAA